jgi:hypothetical protein
MSEEQYPPGGEDHPDHVLVPRHVVRTFARIERERDELCGDVARAEGERDELQRQLDDARRPQSTDWVMEHWGQMMEHENGLLRRENEELKQRASRGRAASPELFEALRNLVTVLVTDLDAELGVGVRSTRERWQALEFLKSAERDLHSVFAGLFLDRERYPQGPAEA